MPNETSPRPRYLISIATYKRVEDLRRLLDSLESSIDNGATIVVTDNDPEQSARILVQQHPVSAIYVAEPTPGIASARNRGLEYFTDEYSAIIFLDDDEWVEPSWFKTLVEFLESHNAGVVQGPVVTVLPADPPAWVQKGSFYQRRLRTSGDLLPSAATNNTAMKRSAWETAGYPRFDSAFSVTGGSDWDLFWGVRKSGSQIMYCANAVVSEDVPRSRLSKKWIRQRYIRNGIVESRVRKKHREPLLGFVLRAIATAGVGALQMAVNIAQGRGVQARSLSRVLIPYGKISGLMGKRIHEYQR